MEAGACYLKMEDLRRAKEAFLLAVKVQPHSPDTHYNLAVVYSERREYEQAISHLRQTLVLDSSHYSALTALATLLSDSDDRKIQEEAMNL